MQISMSTSPVESIILLPSYSFTKKGPTLGFLSDPALSYRGHEVGRVVEYPQFSEIAEK
jgi:hypothetical protein